MKKITVSVTQECMDGACGQSGYHCMVYRAAKPLLSKLECVGVNTAIFRVKGREEFADIPQFVSDLIAKHYRNEPVAPFEFVWELPDKLCV